MANSGPSGKTSRGTVLQIVKEAISVEKKATEVEKMLYSKTFTHEVLLGEHSDPNKVVRTILFEALRARRKDILGILFEGRISADVKARFRGYLTQKDEQGACKLHAIILGFGGIDSKVPRNDAEINEVVKYVCKIFQEELAKVSTASRTAFPSAYSSYQSTMPPPPRPTTSYRSGFTSGPPVRRSTFDRYLSEASAANITTPGPSTGISDASAPKENHLLNEQLDISKDIFHERVTPLDLAYRLDLQNTAQTLINLGAQTSSQLQEANPYTYM